MRYFVIPKWKMVIGAPPKCGSTSIKMSLIHEKVDYEMKYAHQLPKGLPVYFIVRHPLDRFKSLWRFRCVPGGDLVHGTGDDLHGMTPEQFWRFVRKAPADQHWMQQTTLLEDLQVTLVKMQHIQEWWHSTPSKRPLLCYNSTSSRIDETFSAELEAAINKHYDADVRLYEVAGHG